jgi:serine/threonine-protein kinase HipA
MIEEGTEVVSSTLYYGRRYLERENALPIDRVSHSLAELFARMVFDILVSNDDDHLRNRAFLQHDASEGWRLSPLYDVLPKAQLASERRLHLSVGPRGRVATLDNALARFGLLPAAAARVIERIAATVRAWRTVFEAEGVTAGDCDRVASAFRRAADIGMREVEKY